MANDEPTSQAHMNTHYPGAVVGPMKFSRRRRPVHPQPGVVLRPIADPGCLLLSAPLRVVVLVSIAQQRTFSGEAAQWRHLHAEA